MSITSHHSIDNTFDESYADYASLSKLKGIISNYRKDELSIPLDEKHILKWLHQFNDADQDIILYETIHIFESWYFTKVDMVDFLKKVVLFLQKELGFSSQIDVYMNCVFSNNQQNGESQNALIRMLSEIASEEDSEIRNTVRNDDRFVVYVDDGLYSGNRAIKDIENLIKTVPLGSTIYAFYFCATSFGIDNVQDKLNLLAKERSVTIKIFRNKIIENQIFTQKDYAAEMCEESYFTIHKCLWPSIFDLQQPEAIEQINYFQNKSGAKEIYYRNNVWLNDKGVFSSLKNRNIVEKAFLLKGIEIYQYCSAISGLYPLGKGNCSTFGTGTFCAFENNISNTCPLVLWWGNIEPKGNILDKWYPLLPRRVDEKSESAF